MPESLSALSDRVISVMVMGLLLGCLCVDVKEILVLCQGANDLIRLFERNRLRFLRSLQHPLDGLIGEYSLRECQRAGPLDLVTVKAAAQVDDPVDRLLAKTPLFAKELTAKRRSPGADPLGPLHQPPRLPRRIKEPVLLAQMIFPLSLCPAVAAQGRSVQAENLNLMIENAHPHLLTRSRGQGGIERALHLDHPRIVHGADPRLKIAKTRDRQRLQMGLLLQKHLQHLALRSSMDPGRRPSLLPVHQPRILLLKALKFSPL